MQNLKLTRRNFILKLGLASSLLVNPLVVDSALAAGASGKLTGAKLSGSPDALVISLILSAPVKYKVFMLQSPDRVVIDLMRTVLDGNLKQGKHDRPPLTGIRYAARPEGFLRVVLDVSEPVDVKGVMSSDGGQDVLNLKLVKKSSGGASANNQESSDSEVTGQKATQREVQEPIQAPQPSEQGNFVVVIDPGHGGHDPGAIGKGGTREKDVVLAVARKLKSRIDAAPGMRAVLTRSSDSFIPLRQRIAIARKNNADLFISVHADANERSQVHGSSVYILSETGASSEAARLLAESENSYELRLGDVRLAGSSSKIASILLDLSQNATMDRSLELAKRTLRELATVSNPLRSKVESAGFVVLKAPDIPSMLVETAFLSNPQEEKRLKSPAYQQQLADAIFKGVNSYQQSFAPSSVRYASARSNSSGKNYVVRNGDSLSVIADDHGVSVTEIRRANQLNSSQIRVGQKLKIPTST